MRLLPLPSAPQPLQPNTRGKCIRVHVVAQALWYGVYRRNFGTKSGCKLTLLPYKPLRAKRDRFDKKKNISQNLLRAPTLPSKHRICRLPLHIRVQQHNKVQVQQQLDHDQLQPIHNTRQKQNSTLAHIARAALIEPPSRPPSNPRARRLHSTENNTYTTRSS